jgi:DNA-binding response OmpR family regulator
MMERSKNEICILVVDDEPIPRDILCQELNAVGYRTVVAIDGVDALVKVKEQKFDLVISDIKMPRMDGLVFLREAKKIAPKIEVIMLILYGTVELAVAALKEGAYDFVQQPYNLKEILAVIDKALERRELNVLLALYEASKAMFSKIKLADLLDLVMDLIQKVLEADEASIMLINEEKKLCIAASRGLDKEIADHVSLNIGERISGKVCQEKQGRLLINGLTNYPEFSEIEPKPNIGSSIVVPIIFQEDVFGVLNLTRLKGHQDFDSFDYQSASIFISQLAQAIQNAKLYQVLEKKIEEAQKINSIMMGREKRIIELKKEVDEVLIACGKPAKYKV